MAWHRVTTPVDLLLCEHTSNSAQAPGPYQLYNMYGDTQRCTHNLLGSTGWRQSHPRREAKNKTLTFPSSSRETKYKDQSGMPFSAFQIPEEKETLLGTGLTVILLTPHDAGRACGSH